MALPQKLTDALARLNTETDEMASYVRGLQDTISTSMTQEDVDSVHAGLEAVATRLDGIAKDPENPAPPVEPLPPIE